MTQNIIRHYPGNPNSRGVLFFFGFRRVAIIEFFFFLISSNQMYIFSSNTLITSMLCETMSVKSHLVTTTIKILHMQTSRKG